ncbi:MAG: hypothetical protein NT070_04255 [Cyanobacteria bacterium]|nr:hypothetical protein [Cyanobacteriota bacterium]
MPNSKFNDEECWIATHIWAIETSGEDPCLTLNLTMKNAGLQHTFGPSGQKAGENKAYI